MGVGRVLCVALPFILTVGSLIFLLVATLGGITNGGLFMFRVDLTELSIDPLQIPNLAETFGVGSRSVVVAPRGEAVRWHDARLLAERQGNVTAADLGLADLYDVSLWGYCRTGQDGKRECTKGQFNWAESTINTTANDLQAFGSAAAGRQLELPQQITDAIRVFATVTRWTEIAFIAALVCLGVELFFGIFATCSRAWGCVTFLVAGVTSVVVVAAASLATATSVIVVGTVEGTARWYGVSSSFNTSFLSLIWLSAALALGAGFFWMFTVCCCASSSHHGGRKDRKRASHNDAEKLLPTGSYQPLHEPDHHGQHNSAYYGQTASQYGAPRYPSGAPRSDIAYEPYSHRG